MIIPRSLTSRLVVATVLSLCASCALAQATEAEDPVAGQSDVSQVGKIGRLHENIRRAQKRESLYQEITDVYSDYTKWKSQVASRTGVAYSMDVSLLQQWGLPDGGSPSLQFYAAPSVDWTVFRSATWGTGSVQAAYNFVRYPTNQDAVGVQANLGLVTSISDIPTKTNNFAQLTYTQATPDNKWLLTAGQYPLWNFDSNSYLGNQQVHFNNVVFAQNATQTYLLTGLGAYVQYNATSTVHLAAGFQGANNVQGQTLSTKNFSNDCCAWFGYAQWTPRFHGLGSAQYSFSYFATPSIPSQADSKGWSINAVQNLDDSWAVFARANGASGFVNRIKNSYALGVAMNNPLKRASTDQIALAIGLSDLASPPTNPPGARNEIPIEAYWTWTFFGGALVTPSVQYIGRPALDPTRNGVWVLSLRATLMF